MHGSKDPQGSKLNSAKVTKDKPIVGVAKFMVQSKNVANFGTEPGSLNPHGWEPNARAKYKVTKSET